MTEEKKSACCGAPLELVGLPGIEWQKCSKCSAGVTSAPITSDEFDTDWTDYPTCPYCGEEDQDWSDGPHSSKDGGEWTAQCGNCNGSFDVTMSISVNFSTSKLEDRNK